MNLLTTKGLAGELDKPVSTVRRWSRMGLIPVIKVGWRTRLYDPERVRAALQKLEVKSI